MLRKINIRWLLLLISFIVSIQLRLMSQQKEYYNNLEEAYFLSGLLKGDSGPEDVQWINNGNSYSYTVKNDSTGDKEIRQLFPGTLEDKLIVDTDKLSFLTGFFFAGGSGVLLKSLFALYLPNVMSSF